MSNHGTYEKRKRVRRFAKQQVEFDKLINKLRTGELTEKQALASATNNRIRRRLELTIEKSAKKGHKDYLSPLPKVIKLSSNKTRHQRKEQSFKEKQEREAVYHQWIKDGRELKKTPALKRYKWFRKMKENESKRA